MLTTCRRLGAKKTAGALRGDGLGRVFPALGLTFGLVQSNRVYEERGLGGGGGSDLSETQGKDEEKYKHTKEFGRDCRVNNRKYQRA